MIQNERCRENIFNTKILQLMGKLILMICFSISLSCIGSENILKNPDFKQLSRVGLPLYWKLRPREKSLFKFDNGIITLQKSEKKRNVFAIQYDIPFKANKSYLISYEVNSNEKASYKVYIEWVELRANNKKKFLTRNCFLQKANNNWQKKKFEITIPESKKICTPYLILLNKSNKNIQFKKLSISIIESKNAEVSKTSILGGSWANKHARIKHENNNIVLELLNKKHRSRGVLKDIKLNGGQAYKLSFKTWGIGDPGTGTGFYPFKVSAVFDHKIDCSGLWDDTMKTPQTKEFTFTTPNKKKEYTCALIFDSKSKSPVYFKDFKLEKLLPPPKADVQIVLETPTFRDTIYANNICTLIKGKVIISKNVSSATINFIDLKNNKKIAQTISFNKKSKDFIFPTKNLKCGNYKILVDYKTKNNSKAKFEKIIQKLPKAKFEISFRPDKVLLINNKAFFPVMLHRIFKGDTDINLYHAARNGVNSFIKKIGHLREAKAILERAQKYNMKVIFDFNDPDEKMDFWEHKVTEILTKEVLSHPALLGFRLADEPAWNGNPYKRVKQAYDILKYLAPYHPVWIIEAPRGALSTHQLYSQAADIYGIDIYPVPYPNNQSGLEDKSLTAVGKYTTISNKAVNYRKPVWMALQCFAWRSWFDNIPKEKLIYPTFEESRFVVYDSLLAGTTAITFWGAHYVKSNKNFARDIYRVTKELWQISGLLILENKNIELHSNNKDIKLKAWLYNNNIYIIAINLSKKNQNAKISKILNVFDFKVLNENRQIKILNNTLSDNFKPYDVHIYHSGKLPSVAYPLAKFNAEFDKKNYFIEKYRAYKGNANWIWQDELSKKTWSKVGVGKKITIDKKIKSAYLMITADDFYTLYLNHKKIGTDVDKIRSGWSSLKTYNIKELLRKGENVIQITACDSGVLPCGVLVDIKITFEDGSSSNIVTDNSWLVSKTPSLVWGTTPLITKEKAFIVAPYGKGQWKNKLKVEK